jgi:hypothetical protein
MISPQIAWDMLGPRSPYPGETCPTGNSGWDMGPGFPGQESFPGLPCLGNTHPMGRIAGGEKSWILRLPGNSIKHPWNWQSRPSHEIPQRVCPALSPIKQTLDHSTLPPNTPSRLDPASSPLKQTPRPFHPPNTPPRLDPASSPLKQTPNHSTQTPSHLAPASGAFSSCGNISGPVTSWEIPNVPGNPRTRVPEGLGMFPTGRSLE